MYWDSVGGSLGDRHNIPRERMISLTISDLVKLMGAERSPRYASGIIGNVLAQR